MNACNNPPDPTVLPHDDGRLGSQASSAPANPLSHTFPSDSSAPQIESSLLVSGHSGKGSQGSGDTPLRTALDGAHHDSLELGSPDTVVSTKKSGQPRENYRRPIQVVKTNRYGNQDLSEVFLATFDTGSFEDNIVSARLVEYLQLELQTPSRRSRILDILFPWKRKSQMCGVDGESIRHEGKVKIRWYCNDTTTYDKQALWFCPRFYITEHFVVENATADVLFSLSTWDELGLRDRPIAMITKQPQPDMSKSIVQWYGKGNRQKVADDKAKQTETRTEKKSKSATATMQAWNTKKAAKYSSSSSNGNGA